MDDPNKKDDPDNRKDTGKKPVSPRTEKSSETSPRPPKLLIGGASSAAAVAALRQAAEALEKSSDSSGDDDQVAAALAAAAAVAGPDEGPNKDPLQPQDQVQGEGGGASGPKRKRGELDAPRSEPACSTCGRKFNSWKAVFGHMRAHPEREWRGAFPPPRSDEWAVNVAAASAVEQQAALQEEVERQLPNLLNIAEQKIIDKMTEEEAAAAAAAAAAASAGGGAGAGSSSGARARNIDLNVEPVNTSSSSSNSNSPPEKRRAVLDLNQPPPGNRSDHRDGNDDDNAAAGAP